MTLTITQEQYNKLAELIIDATKDSIAGGRAQVFFDPETDEMWIDHLQQGERYMSGKPYIRLYNAEPWEHMLKDCFEDENSDVDWDDENYQSTPEYDAFYNWYFDDCNDGFKVYEILDEALEENGITVED